MYYGLRETNVYTAFAAEYASLAALDQRHAFERYSKFRALYEKAKKEGDAAGTSERAETLYTD